MRRVTLTEFQQYLRDLSLKIMKLNVIPHYGNSRRPGNWNRFLRILAIGCIGAFALLLTSCGGGSTSSSSPSTSTQNPVPGATSISPSSAPAGSRELTVTVTGSKFISGSVVRWGGVARTTTYVSSTKLTAVITPSDLATAGTGAVTVFNPAPGGGTSGSVSFSDYSRCGSLCPDHALARCGTRQGVFLYSAGQRRSLRPIRGPSRRVPCRAV